MSNRDHYDIAGYLEEDGAIGVLVQLDTPNGLARGELTERVHISPTTLTKRLDKAMELDLLDMTRLPEDHGNVTRYQLTKRGEKVTKQLRSLEADKAYRTYIQMHYALNIIEDEIKEWVEDSDLTDPLWDQRPDDPGDHFERP